MTYDLGVCPAGVAPFYNDRFLYTLMLRSLSTHSPVPTLLFYSCHSQRRCSIKLLMKPRDHSLISVFVYKRYNYSEKKEKRKRFVNKTDLKLISLGQQHVGQPYPTCCLVICLGHIWSREMLLKCLRFISSLSFMLKPKFESRDHLTSALDRSCV